MDPKISIVANPTGTTVVDFKQWTVDGEEARVGVTHGDRLYSLILENNDPKVEVYMLDNEGGPGELLGVIDIDSCLYDNQLNRKDNYDY